MDYIDYYESVQDIQERVAQREMDHALFENVPAYSVIMSHLHAQHSRLVPKLEKAASRRTIAYLGYLGVNLGMDVPDLQ